MTYRFARLYVDGGVLGRNPSKRGVYWSVRAERKGMPPITVRKRSAAYSTNTDAEWLAVREGLAFVLKYSLNDPVVIYSDSRLVVNQYNGRFAVNLPRHQAIKRECRELAAGLKFVAVQWRPREVMVRKLGH